MENIPAGIIDFKLCNNKLIMVYHNAKTAELFGFELKDYSEKFKNTPFDAVHPDDRDRVMSEMINAYNSGKDSLETKYRHICNDNSYQWAMIKAHILRRSGNTAYISTLLTNITDSLNTENEHLWQAEKFRILSESAGMITFDYSPLTDTMRLSIPTGNNSIKEEIVTDYLKNFRKNGRVPEAEIEGFMSALSNASEKAAASTYDFCGTYFGTPRRYRANYVSLADITGKVYRIVGRLDDISDL